MHTVVRMADDDSPSEAERRRSAEIEKTVFKEMRPVLVDSLDVGALLISHFIAADILTSSDSQEISAEKVDTNKNALFIDKIQRKIVPMNMAGVWDPDKTPFGVLTNALEKITPGDGLIGMLQEKYEEVMKRCPQ